MDKALVIDYLSLAGILDQVNIHDFINTVLLRDKKHIDSLAALVGIKLHPWAIAFEYRGWTFKLGEAGAKVVDGKRHTKQEDLRASLNNNGGWLFMYTHFEAREGAGPNV